MMKRRQYDGPADRKNCDYDGQRQRRKEEKKEKAGQTGKRAAEQIAERPAGGKCEVAGCNQSRQLEC